MNRVKLGIWNWFVVLYDKNIGYVCLFVDFKILVERNFGRIKFVINYFVRMGV